LPRAAGRQPERWAFTLQLLGPALHYSQWKSVPEKLIGSLVVAYLPTTRDVYEAIKYHLGVSEELSSTAACRRAKDICSTNFVRLRRSTTKTLMLVHRLQERDRFARIFCS
jgi:hypothetical protein